MFRAPHVRRHETCPPNTGVKLRSSILVRLRQLQLLVRRRRLQRLRSSLTQMGSLTEA
jgi:hypothetical protein